MSAYSASRIKSGLLHFGAGKLGSGVLGIALLLLLVRLLPQADYAAMVAMVAAFEVAQLALNLGVLPATWRYLPEARSAGFVGNVSRIAMLSMGLRAVPLALAASVLLCWPDQFAGLFDQAGQHAVAITMLFGVMLFCEGLCRHTDLLFELLLMQRISQALILCRTFARLLGLAVITGGFSHSISILEWALLDVLIAGVGLVVGGLLLHRTVLREGRGAAPQALPEFRRVLRYAMPAYLSQVLGVFQGFEACKLLVSQLASAPVAAGFGFTLSLVSTLQRYLPSYLLAGFVRPLFVHAGVGQTAQPSTGHMASILLKVNLLVLLPAIAIALVGGAPLMSWLSGGRSEGQGMVLAIALLALVLQMAHMVIGLLALSVEESFSGLVGTALGGLGFVFGALFFRHMQVEALVGLVVLAELLWCGIVLRAVGRRGAPLPVHMIEMGKLVLALAGAVVVGLLLSTATQAWAHWRPLVAAIGSSVSFLALVVLLKPLNDKERLIVSRIVPARFILL